MNNVRNVKPWFREPWPWLLMLGPITVILAGVVTAWLAIKSNDGLVSDDYYKQGLTVNQRLHRDHQALQMGIQADLMSSGSGVRLLLRSERGALSDKISLKLAHPTQAGNDQNIELQSHGAGFYEGNFSGELIGRWLVSIEDSELNWRLQGEWQVDSSEPLHLGVHFEK